MNTSEQNFRIDKWSACRVRLPPVKYVVRIHVMLPRHHRNRRIGANDAATIFRFSASGHERLRRARSPLCP
jgi:hypothetical protein